VTRTQAKSLSGITEVAIVGFGPTSNEKPTNEAKVIALRKKLFTTKDSIRSSFSGIPLPLTHQTTHVFIVPPLPH
jgi:hypothetical protein